MPVLYDERPKRDGSRQFITYSLPGHWTQRNAHDIVILMFIKPGPAVGHDLGQFGLPILQTYDRSRIFYESRAELIGPVSFVLLFYYRPLAEHAFSEIKTIDFSRPVLSPVARPGIYSGTQPIIPGPNLDTEGDVYVDSGRGDDTNSGSLNAPVQTIARGIELINERFPTPQQRAGKDLFLREGIYEGTGNPFDSIINLVNYQGGVKGRNLKIRGYPGETVRLRGHQGQRSFYYFALELKGAKHVTLENMIVDNASYMEAINLDHTEGVTLRFMDVYAHGSKWGAQAFGELTDFMAEGCRFSGATGEHNVYVAAGTTTPGKLGRRIVFRGNQFDHASWWGLQINGTVQDVLIENNLFWENGVGPITVKGGSGVTIRNNTIVSNNRQISIENYFDSTYFHNGYGEDPIGMGRGDVNDWWRTHFSTSGYIDIVYNTIVLPEEACVTPHGSGPEEKSAIVLVEFAGTDVNGYPIAEPFKHVRINNNIIVTQHQAVLDAQVTAPMEHSRAQRQMEAFELHDNLFYSTQGPASFGRMFNPALDPVIGMTGQDMDGPSSLAMVGHTVGGRSPMPFGKPLAELESTYPRWARNLFDVDPEFVYLPPCPGPIYEHGVFYDWENIGFPGDMRVKPSSPAVDRGWLATYSSGYRQILTLDGKGRRRLLTPDLGARESHNR